MTRRLLLPLLVGIAVLVSSCGDDGGAAVPSGSSEIDTVIELEVIDGELVGGSRDVRVRLGDRVRAVLRGDSEDQVHFHVYDRYIDPVDGAGEVVFDALIPGVFEVELEGSGRLLIEMTVS